MKIKHNNKSTYETLSLTLAINQSRISLSCTVSEVKSILADNKQHNFRSNVSFIQTLQSKS